MKNIFVFFLLIVSNSSFADTIQVERSWKELGCKVVSDKYDVKRFDLEFCVDNSAFSIDYVNYQDQKVPFTFRGYLYANSVKEKCDGVLLLDKSGNVVTVLDVLCEL